MYLRNLGILGLLLLIAAGQCTAQVHGDNYHGHGYAYVAPAGFTAGGNTLVNYGAGFQYWFKENWALRVEGRDHINTSGPVAHAWQVRFAIVFRQL
jgi:hypothetical protein